MSDTQLVKIGHSPSTFVQDLDCKTGSATLIHLSEAEFRAASFLDRRILTAATPMRQAPWDEVVKASTKMPQSMGPDYIFHLGHVGSTLISRILGDHPEIFALREPPWLRTLADASILAPNKPLWADYTPDAVSAVLTRVSGRTFRSNQRAMIKATSFASEIAPILLSGAQIPRALVLVASPQIHMATLFAGENNRREVEFLGPSRLLRLKRRANISVSAWAELSFGEKCAATWLCEMTSLATALRSAGTSGLALDFDLFLKSPRETLASVFSHFGFAVTDAQLTDLVQSPHFGRYSKAQNFEYSPALRHQLLSEAWHAHPADIRKGMNWIQQSVSQSAELERLLKPFWHG